MLTSTEHEEVWRSPSRSMFTRPVRHHDMGQVIIPICLIFPDICCNHSLIVDDKLSSLSCWFPVAGRSAEQRRLEICPLVTVDGVWDTKPTNYLVHQYSSHCLCFLVGHGKRLSPFGEIITDHQNIAISFIWYRKWAHDINRKPFHWCTHGDLHKCSSSFRIWWLPALTLWALPDPKFDIFTTPDPVVLIFDLWNCFCNT